MGELLGLDTGDKKLPRVTAVQRIPCCCSWGPIGDMPSASCDYVSANPLQYHTYLSVVLVCTRQSCPILGVLSHSRPNMAAEFVKSRSDDSLVGSDTEGMQDVARAESGLVGGLNMAEPTARVEVESKGGCQTISPPSITFIGPALSRSKSSP